MNFNKSQRTMLKVATVGLLGCVIGLQIYIDPLRRQPGIEPKNLGKIGTGPGSGNQNVLPFEYTLGALTGFRQVIAGLLWVRSDSFFHSGNYDAILPLIRMITWLDPNWLDPYATGAWHLMYNFTDTDQRSDRRYLPTGMALLDEGIANNPDVFDMYKEAGWNAFDKIKDYDASAKYYEQGMEHQPDVTMVGHALAHAYDRQGKVEDAIRTWEKCIAMHKAILDDPKSTPEAKGRNQQSLQNAIGQLAEVRFRAKHRPTDSKPPVDADFTIKIVRTKPKVLEISGTWNLIGAKNFDVDKGILVQGPVDGARVEVRLQDAGYTMPKLKEFTFEVDDTVTLMQDQLSVHGGKKADKGGIYVVGKIAPTVPKHVEMVGAYGFTTQEATGLGVPLDKALAGAAPLSPFGQLQVVSAAYPLAYNSAKKQYTPEDVAQKFQQLRGDTAKIAELTKQGYSVATKDILIPGEYKREIDMSKDPKMYSFSKDKFELIVSVNPRNTPDFVKDRIGWNGEGLTDKRYLDTTTMPGVHMIRKVITISKEDLTGAGRKEIPVAP